MQMQMWREAVLRTVAFFDVLHYPPTRIELVEQVWMKCMDNVTVDFLFVHTVIDTLAQEGVLIEKRGRVCLATSTALIEEHEMNASWFPRKIRVARRVASWLARIQGVRFVALCNTTAMMNARDESDLDFFVIARSGTVAQVRAWSTLPFKLLGKRPHASDDERDAVCLSFFVDDKALCLETLMLKPEDPYFRFWFLNLLPLFDDGVGRTFWEENAFLWKEHPFAQPWNIHRGLQVRRSKLNISTFSSLDSFAARVQQKAFPSAIRKVMNTGTEVVVNEHVWKFHLEDGRQTYHDAWIEKCRTMHL